MPAAVSDRPPRNGPTKRYFIPLKAFSSGLDSSLSLSVALGEAAALCDDGAVCADCADLAALDCRSGLVCACAATRQNATRKKLTIKRAGDDALHRKLCGPMVR